MKLVTDRDADALTGSGIIRQVYDPACSTSGMMALTEEHLRQLNDRVGRVAELVEI